MVRPRSIAIFDIAYLAALAVNLAGPFLVWPALTASVAEQAQASGAGVVNGILIGGILVALVVGLLLWWFVARRGSNVARWIAVLALGYGLVSSALGLAGAGGAINLGGLVLIVGMVCTAVALAALFMPDARAWFAHDPEVLS